MLTDTDALAPLLPPFAPFKYLCEKCNYKCCKKRDYERHIMTRKHKNVDKILTDTDKVAPQLLICQCGKNYKHRQSLFVHKKRCNIFLNLKKLVMEKEKEIEEMKLQMALEEQQQLIVKKDCCSVSDEVVLELIKQNKELQQQLFEQNNKMFEFAKEGKYITNNNMTNNFNLNVFLNDKCKDAMTLMDFVESLQVNVKHLEYTSQVGYVEGVSHIFIDGMKDIDVHYRPLHCSDFRREILYIKNMNGWEKEDESRSHISKAIRMINNKNLKQIIEWQKLYPDYNDPESKTNDRYMKMLYNVMSGSTEEEQEANFNKVIRNVAKEVTINKKTM
uniref:C2H2-type domain-containing protein n=1 Tax=viral metagenome TaxID=1070528 RepID=A0A6C0IW24_9ZZZZ